MGTALTVPSRELPSSLSLHGDTQTTGDAQLLAPGSEERYPLSPAVSRLAPPSLELCCGGGGAPKGGACSTPVGSGGGRSVPPGAPLGCCSLAVNPISRLFIVITLITLNSLGINEDVMCTWTGIFIVVQH